MRHPRATPLLVALALAPACTLIESRDGLVGPPIGVATDGSIPTDSSTADGHVALDGAALSDALGPSDAADDAPVGPVTLYADQQDVLGIAADGTYVYWIAGQPRGLLRGPRAGGDPRSIVRLDDATQPVGDAFDLAIDASYVYWTQRGGAVLRRALSGGANLSCFVAGTSAAYLALGGGAIFVSDYRLDGTGTITSGSCGQPSNVVFPTQPRATGVATFGQLVYWGRNAPDQIAFGPTSGGAGTTVHSVLGAVGGVAIDADALYWLRENRRIMRYTFATKEETELYDAGAPFGDGDVAVDDVAVYWTESANGLVKMIPKRAAGGG